MMNSRHRLIARQLSAHFPAIEDMVRLTRPMEDLAKDTMIMQDRLFFR